MAAAQAKKDQVAEKRAALEATMKKEKAQAAAASARMPGGRALLGRRNIKGRRQCVDTPETCRRTVVRVPGGEAARTDAIVQTVVRKQKNTIQGILSIQEAPCCASVTARYGGFVRSLPQETN